MSEELETIQATPKITERGKRIRFSLNLGYFRLSSKFGRALALSDLYL